MPYIQDVAPPRQYSIPIPLSASPSASPSTDNVKTAITTPYISFNMGGAVGGSSNAHTASASNTSISQALEIARDSAEGGRDPVVASILENALAQIWRKVQAQPTAYVMSRDEFAVFNYFQSRFVGNETAVNARKRYWDHTRGTNGMS